MRRSVYCGSHAPESTPMIWRSWSTCQICRRWPMPTLCEVCRRRHAALVPRCPHCAQQVGPGGEGWPSPHTCARDFAWHQAAARTDYVPPMDLWVKRLKFAGDWPLAREMGRLMRECPLAEELRLQADWILPMPVSPQRMLERGYNQAAWLARQWCGRDARVRVHWLLKVRDTAAQAQADRTRRWQQLQGSMAIGRAHQAALQGARVLLVDDVMTTGATLEVATRCALRAGAVRVDVVVFARTPEAG